MKTKIAEYGEFDNKIAINMERAIYNWALKEATSKKIIKKWENPAFVVIYIERARTIYMNLSQDICSQILSGDILPEKYVYMTHQEMNMNRWTELIERKKKRDESKYAKNIEASTDMFSCKKCRSKKCTYYELQTRSADEPATIFVTCLDCGKNWKN
jgi:DNA-directed RNA polymerase subunit M/transcription elongation factor TFIIS